MECSIDGCERPAELIVINLAEMTGEREVCTDCGPEMVALYGWKIVKQITETRRGAHR